MRGVNAGGVDIDDPFLCDGGSFLRVNGVDVIPFVEAELNRRFPGRAARRAEDPDGLRAAWAALERTWSATLARVAALPAGLVASPSPKPSYSRKPTATAPTTHRDADGSTRMLNYPHRLSLGAAHLHLTAQLALLIYLGSLHGQRFPRAMNCLAARTRGPRQHPAASRYATPNPA